MTPFSPIQNIVFVLYLHKNCKGRAGGLLVQMEMQNSTNQQVCNTGIQPMASGQSRPQQLHHPLNFKKFQKLLHIEQQRLCLKAKCSTVFAYFDLAVEISEEDFQIVADLMKADVFGLEQFEILLDSELSKSLGNKLRAHQHSEKVNRNNPIPKRRDIEDTMEMNTNRTAGPSVNTSSARNKEFPTRHPTASYVPSNFPRAQIAHEKRNHMNSNIKATISIQMSRAQFIGYPLTTMSANLSQQEINQQQRVVEDYMDINNKITAGPSANTSSARINEFPTRHPSSARINEFPTTHPTASYTSSNFPRAQIAHEKRNHINFNIKATISIPFLYREEVVEKKN
ncbi:hypothetical protein DAPPUDRAFT_114480 [Daphnia pulex]|uniref:Uncharacterized protein n=1 Tax=Daphnia pulex TaxID=6669 RepID=E9HIA5_DAPPU|nr:hypothetical protein DAPPUDRAFT_114480 [Daphnia pulex]|eukprot:EFX68526.1 hypothetical protein DAPPUDRAFT_114480 [Daphnia pulex]